MIHSKDMEGSIMACFEVLSKHLPGEFKRNHKKLRKLVFRPRFEIRTSKV
jgi:hypothetical protein